MTGPSSRIERFVVLDTETTGFARSDRIVEIALLTVVAGEVVDEFDTLVQPGRDPGPVHVHGITPAMLQAAPQFADLAWDIAARLNGAVIVAHNVHFDLRMLRGEFERIGAAFDPGDVVCTYRLTRKKLSLAAADAGVEHNAHTALGDARVAAALLRMHVQPARLTATSRPATCRASQASAGVTVRRPDAPARRGSLHNLAVVTAWPGYPEVDEALYLDALDRCLDDGSLDEAERTWLDVSADAVGLTGEHRAELHRRYYDLLKSQILADGLVTADEATLARNVARSLDLAFDGLDATTADPPAVRLLPGQRVCFTGMSTVDGVVMAREALEGAATAAGLVPVAGVTRKCDLLVAADPLSQSAKARKAREYEIPILSPEDFLGLIERR